MYSLSQKTELKSESITFSYIREMIGNSLSLHQWQVDNGSTIKAQVKTTIRNGLIKTAYLHVTITYPREGWEYYRECANGNFKLVSAG